MEAGVGAEEVAESGAEQELAAPDAIMEPYVLHSLQHFLQAGGEPQVAIQHLSQGYCGYAPITWLLWQLAADGGVPQAELEELVWAHLRMRVMSLFTAQRADTVLDAGEVPKWLEELLAIPPGQQLIEQLAEEHKGKGSMVLAFAMRRLAEIAAAQGRTGGLLAVGVGEIDERPTDFARAFASLVCVALAAARAEEPAALEQLHRLCCASETCFAYALVLLSRLGAEHPTFARVRDDLVRYADDKYGAGALQFALGAAGAPRHSALLEALEGAVGSRGELTPADVLALHALATDAPPAPGAHLVRANPQLLERLVLALFTPAGESSSGIPYAHRAQYVGLLAHAAAAEAAAGGGGTRDAGVRELAARIGAAARICAENPFGRELGIGCAKLAELSDGCPVVAAGVLAWTRGNLLDPSLATSRLNMAAINLIVPLLDTVAERHPRLRPRAASTLADAFEHASQPSSLDAFSMVAVKRRLIDSLLHLACIGEAVLVVGRMTRCMQRTDLALARHFVTELVAMAAPPFSREFLHAVGTLCGHKRIDEAMRAADTGTQRALLDLIGRAHAELDEGALNEQCIALHDGLLQRLAAS